MSLFKKPTMLALGEVPESIASIDANLPTFEIINKILTKLPASEVMQLEQLMVNSVKISIAVPMHDWVKVEKRMAGVDSPEFLLQGAFNFWENSRGASCVATAKSVAGLYRALNIVACSAKAQWEKEKAAKIPAHFD